MTTTFANNEAIDLTIVGQKVVLPTLSQIIAGAQVSLETGTWTGAVFTVKVSNDPDGVFWVDHPSGHTLSAEGVIDAINCSGWRWVAVELTTASSTAGSAVVYMVGKDIAAADAGGVASDSPALLQGAESMLRVLASPLAPSAATLLLVTDTAYWVFLGRLGEAKTIKFVEWFNVTAGAGAQTAEVALASGSGPPSKGSVTLTKIAADGTLDSVAVNNTMCRNTTTMAASVPAGTYLYAGIRTAMAVTQPTIAGLVGDNAEGFVLSTATPGALTGSTTWVGAVIAAAAYGTAVAPDLRATMD